MRDDHARADLNPLKQIDDVLVVHADAAIGDKAADRTGSLVPWMAYSSPTSVIAAAPIGLLGKPPGMT